MWRSARISVATVVAACWLLAGCGSSPDVRLTSRPTDLDSARALARLVADRAACGGFEDYAGHTTFWDFTCERGRHSYTIRAVTDDRAKQAAVTALGRYPCPLKAGPYYLVQEEQQFSGKPRVPTFTPLPVRDLDRFPGTVLTGDGK